MNPDDNSDTNALPSLVRITDPREPDITERLRTPTASGIYSHTGKKREDWVACIGAL